MALSRLQAACGALAALLGLALALLMQHLPLLSMVASPALLADALFQHPSPLARHPVTGFLTLNPLVFDVFQDGEKRHSFGATREDLGADLIYVITGSSGGIGLSLARKLEGLVGAERVVYAVRSPRKVHDLFASHAAKHSDALGGGHAARHVMRLDLNSLSSVATFASNFSERLRRGGFPLDPARAAKKVVLVNNAGVAWHKERRLTEDGFEEQFQSNVLGHYLLTRLLLQRDLLQRVVHTSSAVYHTGSVPSCGEASADVAACALQIATDFHANKYSDTKFMNVLFSNALARKFPDLPSVAVHPGVVATDIMRDAGLAGTAVQLAGRLSRAAILSPDEAANNLLYALFPAAGVQGGYVSDMQLWPMNPRTTDVDEQDLLWRVCEVLVKRHLLHEEKV